MPSHQFVPTPQEVRPRARRSPAPAQGQNHCRQDQHERAKHPDEATAEESTKTQAEAQPLSTDAHDRGRVQRTQAEGPEGGLRRGAVRARQHGPRAGITVRCRRRDPRRRGDTSGQGGGVAAWRLGSC